MNWSRGPRDGRPGPGLLAIDSSNQVGKSDNGIGAASRGTVEMSDFQCCEGFPAAPMSERET